MIRVQIAPEIEFKMEVDLGNVDIASRDYDVQQSKALVYAEFEKRIREAFPEGFRISTFEFGLDTGWHEGLKDGDDAPVIA